LADNWRTSLQSPFMMRHIRNSAMPTTAFGWNFLGVLLFRRSKFCHEYGQLVYACAGFMGIQGRG
jgi:hypothetical protein